MDTPLDKIFRQKHMPARIVPSQNNANLEALEQQKENQEGLREART